MQEQILGDYKILKQIGEGTLGNVLLAEHRFIKKQYVLKVLPGELCQDKAFIERFEEEVAKIALLDHPHIVKTHTVSFSEGLYFLVTDCIVDSLGETTNLAHYMSGRKERLREEELLSLMRQVADAIDYAHSKGGVVHRALKLNNILIGKGSLGLKVFIADFGIEKMITPGKVVLRTFKTVAEALGTLPAEEAIEERYTPTAVVAEKLTKLSQSFLQGYAFLAPEQKKFENVGAPADIYAFGVLAYFVIAGQFPEGVFPMPSEIAPEYNYDWDLLISECLCLDPKRRPRQLLPLLDRKKIWPQAALTTPFEPVSIVGDSAMALEPFKNKEQLQVPQPLPTPVVAHLKSALLRPPPPQHTEKEESTLRPIIQRRFESESPPSFTSQTVAVQTVVPVAVQADSKETVVETTESYVQQLNAMLNRDPIVTQYQPEKKENRDTEPLQSEMIVVPGGQFMRGSNSGNRDEMPCHKISLHSFAMDIHPVTNEQFVRFLEFMGGEKDQNYNDLIRLKDSRLSRTGGKLSIESGYAKRPVVGVTWYGAVAYTKWAGNRLPTEAEWEIAVRGGKEHCIYPTGDQIEKTQANFFSSDTTPVMSYAPNAYGLHDMVGNVYEWCQDWYGYNYYEISVNEPSNPRGPLQGVYRVLRGGCWKSLQEDMRCSHRHRNNPGTVNSTYGFRCAADVQ